MDPTSELPANQFPACRLMSDFLTPEPHGDPEQDESESNTYQRTERVFVSRLIDPRGNAVRKSKTKDLFKTVDKVE